jgi:hypothetical protein
MAGDFLRPTGTSGPSDKVVVEGVLVSAGDGSSSQGCTGMPFANRSRAEAEMNARHIEKVAVRALAAGASLAALGYAGLVAYHRARYGKWAAARAHDSSLLVDRFIPSPEVSEHHRVRIAAPADVVMSTAKGMELLESRIVRTVFRLRELALGGQPDERRHPSALLPQMQSIGWRILAERAGREIVLGAVTRPWEAAPTFRSIPAADFTAFQEPGYVKIVWNLRADPLGPSDTLFHTETRVATTDRETRLRFRRYWSFVAPGVELIRLLMLRPLKKASERRAAGGLMAGVAPDRPA